MANGWAPRAKRLATAISAGRLRKPPYSLFGRANPEKRILPPSNTNMAKPKRSRYSPTSWAGPCITCARANTRLIPNAL